MAKVDVVIPCYNYGRFLEACVRSVLDQSVADVRILIVDDASADDSRAVAQRLARADARVSAISHDRNFGHIATYNEGIAWASSDYFLLLSADDMLAPGALERAVAIMDRDDDIVLVHGEAIRWNDSQPLPILARQDDARWTRHDIVQEMCSLGANTVATPTAIGRTSIQKRIGGYDPSLPHTADMEMWLRYGTCGAVARVDAVQAIYRLHASNMSSGYYDADGMDLPHRKRTFDCFFEKFPALPDAARLRKQANIRQAGTALSCGLHNIDRGRIAEGLKLVRLSINLHPLSTPLVPLKILKHLATYYLNHRSSAFASG